MAVGCDGTNVNSGVNNGVIKKLEDKLQRPLQWFICQLHANELLLRHLFKHYDGDTTGPKGYSGPISSALVKCEKLPVQKFKKISAELPELESTKDLSKDQKYLLEISRAVVTGECSEDLALKNPGPMSHARWLTTANRLLRLYVATARPDKKLKSLAALIVKVYSPVWFSIKNKQFCYDGAKNLWKTIFLSRNLEKETRTIIDPVIQRNGYFGHCETILLAMMVDERKNVREQALKKILDSRQKRSSKIRKFRLPNFKFDAADYTDLIEWVDVTEPPITRNISDDELSFLVLNLPNELKKIMRFPCHTQAVERHIKLVTQASMTVIGQEARDSLIRGGIKSRSIIPEFNFKKHYNVN